MSSVNVYHGLWINWDKGKIFGSTLTLSAGNGALLISFFALFVRLSGTHLWNIIRYVLHQSRSRSGLNDGLYHQQQAILRNSASNIDTLSHFLRLSYYWRKRASRISRRQLPLQVLASLHILALGAAGVFSSRLTTLPESEVLIKGSADCGSIQFPSIPPTGLDAGSLAQYTAAEINRKQHNQASQIYKKACYDISNSTVSCNTYKKRKIPSSIRYQQPCPFSGFCVNEAEGSVELDSGIISSLNHLGMNTPSQDSVGYRTSLTCAPIITDGYHSSWVPPTGSNQATGEKVMNFFYGPSYDNSRPPELNYTFSAVNYAGWFSQHPYIL